MGCGGVGGGCKISGGPPTNNDDIVKRAAELKKMKKRAEEDAKKQEANIIQDINETMEDFIGWIKKENADKVAGVSLDINIERIEKLNADLRDDVVGFIGRKLSDRLVMTDKELDRILAEPDDGKRNKNFNDFYDRIWIERSRSSRNCRRRPRVRVMCLRASRLNTCIKMRCAT